MFRIACFVTMFVSFSAFSEQSQRLRWADLVEGKTYKVDRKIELSMNDEKHSIEKDSLVKLLDMRPLPMINVFLAEMKVLDCEYVDFTSEMVIVEVEQPAGKAVGIGIDMAERCVLEVFLENKDYDSLSIFK